MATRTDNLKNSTALPPDLDLGGDEPTAPALSKQPVGMPKLVKIIVEEADAIAPTGLMLGLNGKAYLIRPGEEVNVPQGIIEILDNARVSIPRIDNMTKRISGWSDRPRFAYRNLGAVAA